MKKFLFSFIKLALVASAGIVVCAYKGIPPGMVPPPVITPTVFTPAVTGVAPKFPATGKYRVSAVINWTNKSGQTISGLDITGGSSNCIYLTNCHNITIAGNNLHDSKIRAIELRNCYNITIQYNNFTNVTAGVNNQDSPHGNNVVINYNRFHNMLGPRSAGGQYVQFNNASGAGCSVSYNRGDNVSGQSDPEDCVSMYMSKGTPSSPIKIIGNWIRGGGPSKTGGGIMLGDNGGSYQYAANNIIVNPGNYGIAIAGGDHISIVNNQVYSAQSSISNVGIYLWAQQSGLSSVPTITNATVSGNQVWWYSGKAGQIGMNTHWIGPGVASKPDGWTTNKWNANISDSILPPVNTW